MSQVPARDFGFGEDEQLLRDLAHRFLDEHMPVERLRALVAADPEAAYERGERSGWDEGIWKQIGELGWAGLAVPESAGGVGGRMVGIAALVEEVGRHALPSPLVATLCTAFALREARTPAADVWLARIADGAAASLAITDARGSWDPADCGVAARADGGDLVLSGAAHFVQDAFKADFFVVSARGANGIVLCAVPAGAAGTALEQNHIHDLTRDQATLRCDDVRVARADAISEENGVLRRAWPAVLVAVAADLCGTSEWQ